MRNWTAACAAAVVLGLFGSSPAAAAKAAAPKAAKPPKCSACGMTLSTKKTAATPKAVKIGGKTYYCCSACKMSAKK